MLELFSAAVKVFGPGQNNLVSRYFVGDPVTRLQHQSPANRLRNRGLGLAGELADDHIRSEKARNILTVRKILVKFKSR